MNIISNCFSFNITMIMSIFHMNHANMGHSRVIRSDSLEEELIHQYVCLTFKSKTVFFNFSMSTSPQ